MNIKFGTKAETLELFSGISDDFTVPELIFFSHSEWKKDRESIILRIKLKFQDQLLAIRSSAFCEDSQYYSMAGVFESKLNVRPSDSELIKAITTVINSYSNNESDLNQIIAQQMVSNSVMSGVAMNYVLESGAPYYVISYDDKSNKTDVVTSGIGIHKTVYIHRQVSEPSFKSKRLKIVFNLIKNIEKIISNKPVDIEFSVDNGGNVYLLQIRPISTLSNWNKNIENEINTNILLVSDLIKDINKPATNLYGKKTIYSNMSDWNPAEMIQIAPKPLSFSLYRQLITKEIWALARKQMGYSAPKGIELMKLIGGHAYIDVRASLNSFLPLGLSDSEKELLINSSLDRLMENPSYNDKLEFDVAITIRAPNYNSEFSRIYAGLGDEIRLSFDKQLKILTSDLIDCSDSGILSRAEKDIAKLREQQRKQKDWKKGINDSSRISYIQDLISECVILGTLPFSILARHGFIAESLLRSFIEMEAVSFERAEEIKQSIQTVARDLSFATSNCMTPEGVNHFLDEYGHLRPGTYDIESPIYSDTPDLFLNPIKNINNEAINFTFSNKEKNNINLLLEESGINKIDANNLIDYISRSVRGREFSKLTFTRSLSKVLELIADWGEKNQFSRTDLAFISIQDLFDMQENKRYKINISNLKKKIKHNKAQWELARSLHLSPVIKNVDDLYIVPAYRATPNFVTRKRVISNIYYLAGSKIDARSLDNRIICIESADPGMDWIFGRNLNGLITMYGGANSHMNIRCAEFNLPAAIGVGEELFNRLISARKLELNCADKVVHIIS